MFDEPIRPFLPGEYRFKLATAAWEIAAHHALRRAVFCDEQGIFTGSDNDALDDYATRIIGFTCIANAPDDVVGAVRIHEAEPGLWWGSRLAVAAAHRRVGRLGAELIRLAVCTANARGCHTFLAHVQLQNVALFRRLHWDSIEPVSLHGRPHHVMRASLPHYAAHGLEMTRLVRPMALRTPSLSSSSMLERAA
jgi:putative N-acetyltransferase (TIGR04045 family)